MLIVFALILALEDITVDEPIFNEFAFTFVEESITVVPLTMTSPLLEISNAVPEVKFAT